MQEDMVGLCLSTGYGTMQKAKSCLLQGMCPQSTGCGTGCGPGLDLVGLCKTNIRMWQYSPG